MKTDVTPRRVPRRRIPFSSWTALRYRLVALLAVVGPGFITANVDNDPGGILTYSNAGAKYGYTLLWTLIPTTIALIVIQEMAARMGAITGKGLSDLIREEFGLRMTFFTMLVLSLADFGNIASEFAGIASGVGIFGVSKYISVPIGAALVWTVIVRGSYKPVERVLIVAGTEHRRALERRMAPELVPHILVEAQIMEKVIALEDAMVLEHPPVLFRHERPQDRGAEFGVVVRGERIADVMQQRAHHVLFVHAVTMCERGRLQRMLHPIHREATAIAFEQLQMRDHAVWKLAIEGDRVRHDLHPVFLRALGHRMELGAILWFFGHGCSSQKVA